MSESLLDEIQTAWDNAVSDFLSLWPKATGVTPYNDLPWAPAGPGDDSHVTRSLDDLADYARPNFMALEARFPAALGPIGYKAVRAETKRTVARQAWLYGIGRDYRAPGRDGIVTNAKGANGPHAEGRAVDYDYIPIDPAMTPDPDALKTALAGLADDMKQYGMTWGGNWTTLVDPRHWENESP